MISLSNMDPPLTDAGNRAAMLSAGVTQESQSASTQAARKAGAAAMEEKLDGTSLGANPRISLNPLAIGPVSTPNYQQPNTGSPAASGAGVQIENHRNPLNITAPQTPYVQPGVAAPPPPAPGQLSTLSYGSIATSGAVRADGTRIF